MEVRGTGRKTIKGTHGRDRVKGALEEGQGHRTVRRDQRERKDR